MEATKLQEILENHKKWLLGGGGERADLRHADLSSADLIGANLSGADLRGTNLSGADLSGADLGYATLNGADLSSTDLRGANLRHADLKHANLKHANLNGADLSSVVSNADTTMYNLQCPEEGSYIAWKKCNGGVLVKLLIPEDALRSSATSRKCRASKAIVLEVIGAEYGVSSHDNTFIYKVGETVKVLDFDTNRWKECSTGIQHFITRSEAESY